MASGAFLVSDGYAKLLTTIFPKITQAKPMNSDIAALLLTAIAIRDVLAPMISKITLYTGDGKLT
ncbi:hypothetical protein AU512_10610 [Lonsdalea iberica]|uniref:Uncharacterized protein n=1 Tax=Lonsdalea iberica TaxID=1082703 RepID=A0ABX3XEN4_9GAMM|nr:hypothetical protein AU512_10610 [Lonsdalea iberica]